MDGFFPAGNDNARVIPDIGPAVSSFTPLVVSYFDFANIGETPYALVFTNDGAVYSVNTTTEVKTLISGPGTIQSPGSGTIGVSQWGSQYILIVNIKPNGYFIWDGAVWYNPGDPVPGVIGPGPITTSAVFARGNGYLVGETGTIAADSGDATYIITSIVGPIFSANVNAGGAGYVVGDTGIIHTGNNNATYRVTSVSAGSADGITVINGGTGYSVFPNATTDTGGPQPGAGAGLIINIYELAPGNVIGFSLVSNGTFYNTSGSVPTAVGGANPGSGSGFRVAIAIASAGVPVGVSGTAVETFLSRVWTVKGSSMSFSAPGSFVVFATSGGGGSITSNEPSLRVKWTQLKQSNGYLYIFGDSSVSYVSGVQTTGSPPSTTFSLQNVDPEVGTPWPDTVNVMGSNIVFANAWGVHVSYGGRAAKVSPELDGIYNTVPDFGGFIPSAAKAILFGRRVWVLLLRVIDQTTSLAINKLFIWDQKSWCSTQQSAILLSVRAQEINSVLTAWGTDGLSIYRLFQQPTTNLTKTLRSKFWSPMLLYADIKTESRLWGLVKFYSGSASSVTISVDSENGPSPTTIPITPPVVGDGTLLLPVTACGQQGALVGFTLTTNASDIAILSLATMPVHVQYRG